MFVGKQFDPVIGVDIHFIQPPGPVPPVPIPHPFFGIVFDPWEFTKWFGANTLVNGIPRAQAGSAVIGLPPHFPIGGIFVKPPSNDGEIFMGSLTVVVELEPLAFLGNPVLTCHDIGMPPVPRPNRKSKSKPKSLVLPTSILLPIPKGQITIVGSGLLMISFIGVVVDKILNLNKLKKGTDILVKWTKKITKEITEKIAEEIVELSAIVIAKKVARNFSEKPVREAVEKAVKEFIDDGIEEVIEDVSGKFVAELSEKILREGIEETVTLAVEETVSIVVDNELVRIEKNAVERVIKQRGGI
jgi:hypothetical protein